MPKPSTADADQKKALGNILAAGRKSQLNFAALIAQGGTVVLRADRRKSVENVRKQAKSEGGGAQGAWGQLSVSGKLISLACEKPPPAPLAKMLKKQFGDNGYAVQVEAAVIVADMTKTAPPPAGPVAAAPSSAPEPVAEVEDAPDTPVDGEGASGNLGEIIAKARKKPQSFAWLYGDDGMILRAHPLKNPDVMLRLAKQDGGQPKGAWGKMSVEGKSLVLNATEDPPGGFIKRAKQALRDQGQKFRVVLRSPSGEVVEELDPEPEYPTDNTDEIDELKSLETRLVVAIEGVSTTGNKGLTKKLEGLAVMLGNAIQAGDVAQGKKIATVIESTVDKAGVVLPDEPDPVDDQLDLDEMGETALGILAAESDRIFYLENPEFSPSNKIKSKDSEAAEIWLAIRKRVAARQSGSEDPNPGPDAPGGAQAYATEEEIVTFLYSQRDEKLRHDLSGVFNLDMKEVERLEQWAIDNSMREEEHTLWTDETGGDVLAEALEGKSDLGALTEDQQSALLFQVAQKWVFSPERGEDGALENIAEFTAFAKKHPELRSKVAAVFIQIDSLNTRFSGANYDKLEQEREVSSSLRDHAIDLDPMVAARGIASKGGPEHLARILLGQIPRTMVPGANFARNPDRYGGHFEPPSEARRNAILKAVGDGALPDAASDIFMNRMFASSSRYDVSPVDTMLGTWLDSDVSTEGEQESMARLLAGRANARVFADEEQAARTKEHFKSIMNSPGGREVLFSTSIDTEFRTWALENMTPDPDDPDKKTWTATDMANGWESDVVCLAFGEAAVEQAKEAAEERPLHIDPKTASGSATNLIGKLLGKNPDNLPNENETEEERKKREAAGFNHPMYDTDEEPISSYVEHVIGPKGKPFPPAEIIVIPITLINREEGPASFKVLRIEREGAAPFFMDDKGNRYNKWTDWKTDNELPPGKVTFPGELDLSKPLDTAETPAGSNGNRILSGLDKVAMAAGAVAGVAVIIGSGGTLAPAVGAAAAAWGGGRAVQTLWEMDERHHDITDLGDSQVRGLYLDVAANAFSAGAMGGTKLAQQLAKSGAKLSRTGANMIAGLTFSGNVADALTFANEIEKVASRWDKMSEAERSEALLGLSFQMGMSTAGRIKGGTTLADDFNIKRMRNQIENKTPFDLIPAKDDAGFKPGETVALRYDKKTGQPTGIVYRGEKPSPEMIKLHSDIGIGLEATNSLKNRIMRRLKKVDPSMDKAPKGSAAWEAELEINKIETELRSLNSDIASATTPQERQALKARQIELNAAIVRESARLEKWDEMGRGLIASPGKGAQTAKDYGWDTEPPDGFVWVDSPDGPFVRSATGDRRFYDAETKRFYTSEEIVERAEFNQKFEEEFMSAFDMDRPEGPIVPDKTITAGKTRLPNPLEAGMTAAEFKAALGKELNLSTEEVSKMVDTMGDPVSDYCQSAWDRAVARSETAQTALKEAKLKSNLADMAERQGRDAEAKKLRKEAKAAGKKAYEPVQGNFWGEVYSDDALKKRFLDAGFKIEGTKAPYLELPDGTRQSITLEHLDRKSDVPGRAQDASNLVFSFGYENSVVLEHIRRIETRYKDIGKEGGLPDEE